VGPDLQRRRHDVCTVRDLRHDLEVVLKVEEDSAGSAHHRLVLAQKHPDHAPPPGRVATSRNPSLLGSTTNVPPAETTRSRTPSMPPFPHDGAGGAATAASPA